MTVLITIVILAIWSAKNLLNIEEQGLISDLSGLYQILSCLFVVLVIFTVSPSLSSSKFVFEGFHNETGFSDPYVCVIGILSSLYAFAGYEASGTMAEET